MVAPAVGSRVLAEQRTLDAEALSPQAVAMLATLDLPLIAIGRDEQVRYANAAAAPILSCPVEQAVSEPLPSVLNADLPADARSQLLRALHLGEDRDIFLEHEDSGYWLAVRARPWGCLVIALDPQVLGPKRERALTAALSEVAFDASVGHELRTPLSVIRSMTEVLITSGLNADQAALAEHVMDSTMTLLTHVEQLIEFARLAGGHEPGRIEAFDPYLVIEEASLRSRTAAESKGLAFETRIDESMPAELVGDVEALRRAIAELLGNAVKFCAEGRIGLEASLRSTDGGGAALMIEVSDTGIGVPDKHAERIFVPFVQLDASDARSFEGMGLGLAVARQLVHRSGGELHLRHRESGDTCFVLRMPVRA